MSVPVVGDDNSNQLAENGDRAVLWLELAVGSSRERLIERLAQAHLITSDVVADRDAFLGDLRGRVLEPEP
jgi:hypothetical protein